MIETDIGMAVLHTLVVAKISSRTAYSSPSIYRLGFRVDSLELLQHLGQVS